jgi:hypothetical protein
MEEGVICFTGILEGPVPVQNIGDDAQQLMIALVKQDLGNPLIGFHPNQFPLNSLPEYGI